MNLAKMKEPAPIKLTAGQISKLCCNAWNLSSLVSFIGNVPYIVPTMNGLWWGFRLILPR